MQPFQYFKVVNTHEPLLAGIELDNLGSVNIICGKNNSGKSTLLKGIEKELKTPFHGKPKHVGIGKYLDDAGLEQICNAVFTFVVGGHPVIPERSHQTFKEAVKKVSHAFMREYYKSQHPSIKEYIQASPNRKPILFEQYVDEFSNSIVANWGGSSNRELQAKLKTVLRTEFFPKAFNSVLIDPKRNLPPKCEIDTQAHAQPDGQGVLERLFTMKNVLEGSEQFNAFKKLEYEFEHISGGYKFTIEVLDHFETSKDPKNTIMLKFRNTNYSNAVWIEADSCGLGLRDLLIILYFSITPDYNIILLEEPENHLHPDMQRKLLTFLREQSEQIGKQFFITTHSNIFLDYALVDKVFLTSVDESQKKIHVADTTNKAFVLSQLGYAVADNLVSDLTILVEGPSDIPVIRVFLEKMGLDKKYNIKIWPIGGDIMGKREIDLSIFAENRSLIALIDRDPESTRPRKRFIEKCNKLHIDFHQLERYAIENYFTVPALKEVFGGQIPDDFTSIAPDIKLEKQLTYEYFINDESLTALKNANIFSEIVPILQTIHKQEYFCDKDDVKALETTIGCLNEHIESTMLNELAGDLDAIKGIHYKTKAEFIDALEEALEPEKTALYTKLIISHCQRTMDVKSKNHRIAQAMTIDDIQTTDLYTIFFQKVKNLLAQVPEN